jgi:hypothetical protein
MDRLHACPLSRSGKAGDRVRQGFDNVVLRFPQTLLVPAVPGMLECQSVNSRGSVDAAVLSDGRLTVGQWTNVSLEGLTPTVGV